MTGDGRRSAARQKNTETTKRDLRTGRPLWADSQGVRLPVRALTAAVEVDVVIVGAGVSGAFMAHELSRDMSIAVIDRRGPIRGSTLASTAMLQWELDLPLIALADQIGAAKAVRVYKRSHAAVAELVALVRRERIACGLKAKSSLYLAGDVHGWRALRQETSRRADLGFDSVFLDHAALDERFGLDRTGAILSAGSASADPARLAAGLLRRASANGARIFAPVEAAGVLRGRETVTVVTDAGVELRARQVVFCCGYEFPEGVPIDGAKVISTWAIASQPMTQAPAWLDDCLVWEASDPYLYCRTSGDGRLIVGGEDEASSARHQDPKALAAKTRAIVAKITTLIPRLDVKVDYAWAGAFGESATSMPLIGAVPDMPRAYAVMGFGGNGITYSMIASRIVGAAIRGRLDPEADLFAFE